MHSAAQGIGAPSPRVPLPWCRSGLQTSHAHALLMFSKRKVETVRVDWARLISAVANDRDRSAFAELFEFFAPRIKSFMRRSGVSEAVAEELAQEAMLTVWRKAALFDPTSTGAAAWMFTIARNLRVDAHRREKRGGSVKASNVETEFQIDESPQPDSRLAAIQSEQRVRAALSQLSSDQMRVVELSFFEEKAHAEIAELLDIPLGTVKSRLRLAMARLRNLLSEMS
jgi:RNA polymerase sigma-70 factor, ECF subfamily